jgi:hypothetical protein
MRSRSEHKKMAATFIKRLSQRQAETTATATKNATAFNVSTAAQRLLGVRHTAFGTSFAPIKTQQASTNCRDG